MTYFLSTQLRMDEKKRLVLRSQNFFLVEGILYHKGSNGISWRGIRQEKKNTVLREADCDTTRGHYTWDVMAQKVWQAGLWWPTTQRDAYTNCKACDLWQQMGQPRELAWLAHKPVLPLEPFQKWGLDFVIALYTSSGPYGKEIYFSSHGLLYEMGGCKSFM